MPLPSPSRPLIACSLAAILLCALLCALCTAALLHPWGIRGLGGLLLLPGFLGLGLTQYAGTFQAKAARAETVARLYAFTGGFMLIALVCLLFDIARSGQHPPWPVFAVGAAFVVLAVWGRIGSRLNREWAEELRRFEAGQEDEQRSAVRHGHPIVWITTCLVFLTATAAFYWAFGPRSGEHVEPAASPFVLPEGVSDLGYWMYAGNTVFEFSISEPGFLAWAEPQIRQRQGDFDGMKAVAEPQTIPTYRAWLPDTPLPHEAMVEDGYYHGWQQSGKTIEYAYDRKTGRAYYASTSHLGGL